MASYLVKVKKKMNSYAERQSRGAFVGNYGSILKGRSMDFDDLRAYNYGDDVKDIDWKASARSRDVMIRRYIAIRKHNILIVADSSRAMATLSASGEKKSEVAAFCAASIALIATKHNDLIGMLYGDHSGNKRFPMREQITYAENFIKRYAESVKPDSAEQDMNSVLKYISKAYRERMFIITITDPSSALSMDRNLIRHLGAKHELMFCLINDGLMSDKKLRYKELRDVNQNVRLPKYIRSSKALAKAERRYRETQELVIKKTLAHYRIENCFVNGCDDAVAKIIKMLGDQRNAHKRH